MMTSPTVSWKLLKSLFLALSFLFYGNLAQAQVALSWDVQQKMVIDGQREVELSFKASEAGSVFLKDKKLFHLTGDKSVKHIDDEKIRGLFPLKLGKDKPETVTLVLPVGLIQMPIEFKPEEKEAEKQSLLISFKTDLTSNLPKVERETHIKQSHRKVLISAGLGVTYLRYTQESTVTTGALSFANTEAPSLSISGELGLTDNFSFASFMNVAPGSVQGSETLRFNSEQYHWIIYGLEGVHFPTALKFNKFTLGYRFGGQMHQMPFISRTSTNGVANIETNFVGNLSLGPMVKYVINPKWEVQSYFRLQYPIFWGFLFKIEPQVTYDGSISVLWRPNPESNWSYSAHWFGQAQKFTYTHTDILLQGDTAGTLDLFFSGIDFRAGYEF